jgi:hypothetical protein
VLIYLDCDVGYHEDWAPEAAEPQVIYHLMRCTRSSCGE